MKLAVPTIILPSYEVAGDNKQPSSRGPLVLVQLI